MSRKPRTAPPKSAPPKTPPKTSKPVEVVGQTLERALDPLTSALKRAALHRADKTSRSLEPAKADKTAMPVSPLAVPFPRMRPIRGLTMATGRAGFYKHERDDLLVMAFPEGASCAGVFTRHGVGSAPVDWCKRHLENTKGEADAGQEEVNYKSYVQK